MTATFWDKRARKYDDEIRKHEGVYEQTLASTKSLLSDADVVLDFGCASGEFSLDIAASVGRVHGIDTSAGMIALAAQKAKDRAVDNASFSRTDLLDPSLDQHGYTRVLAFSILHLVEDARAADSKPHRRRARGGSRAGRLRHRSVKGVGPEERGSLDRREETATRELTVFALVQLAALDA